MPGERGEVVYKEIIICVVVVVSIVGLNWYIQDYTKNSITTISDKLDSIKNDLKEEKIIDDKIKDLHDSWDDKCKMLAIFIEHDELEKVETNIVALEGYVEVGDYSMGINEVNKGVFVLKHIAEKYDFSLVNVF